MQYIKKVPWDYPFEMVIKIHLICVQLPQKMLIIISLSLTDWANLPNDLLLFGLLLGHNAKCLVRATISGQTKITFSALSSFSTHRVPENRCDNFPEMLLLMYVPLSMRVKKNFPHSFDDFINFPITCIDTII